MKVRVSPVARGQLELLAAWWNEHRRDARIRVYAADPKYRTWRLRGTPYVLFYRIDEAASTFWVVVAWSARRGVGPELP